MLRSRASESVSTLALVAMTQRRGVKYTTLSETLKPVPGHSAGTLNVMNEICINPETDEENKRPVWRNEVIPSRDEKTYLNTMWKFGYNSLTLYKKVNESSGPWWNANNTTLTSNWSQIGEYCAAGLWSGIWRYTYGVGQFNLKPGQYSGKTFGNVRGKAGEIRVDYKEEVKDKPDRLVFPHLEEHKRHQRIEQPLNGNKVVNSVHSKRLLRECQYQLAQGLRYYMIDGVFGSHPATSTPYRIFTDNPNSAYFAGMTAIRNRTIVAQEELVLLKRLLDIPLDEWTWRRPGVLIYHCPSYDFELPRIVEEFGGPRPEDLGLTTPRFTCLDPYSIPMKALVGAEPSCNHLLDTVALLSARWGYYADDKELLSVAGDSVISADGKSLTIVISNGNVDTDAIRASPRLFGAHHHRIADGVVSRAWDTTTIKSSHKAQKGDYVEESLGVLQRPLATHVGNVDGTTYRSHRYDRHRRHIADWGYKFAHNYTTDPKEKAASAGMLFGTKGQSTLTTLPRPSAFHLDSVTIVVVNDGEAGLTKVGDATAAAGMIVDGLTKCNGLYAEAAPLKETFAKVLPGAAAVMSVGSKAASAVVEKLAKTGQL